MKKFFTHLEPAKDEHFVVLTSQDYSMVDSQVSTVYDSFSLQPALTECDRFPVSYRTLH
jgi:hypothetical protein